MVPEEAPTSSSSPLQQSGRYSGEESPSGQVRVSEVKSMTFERNGVGMLNPELLVSGPVVPPVWQREASPAAPNGTHDPTAAPEAQPPPLTMNMQRKPGGSTSDIAFSSTTSEFWRMTTCYFDVVDRQFPLPSQHSEAEEVVALYVDLLRYSIVALEGEGMQSQWVQRISGRHMERSDNYEQSPNSRACASLRAAIEDQLMMCIVHFPKLVTYTFADCLKLDRGGARRRSSLNSPPPAMLPGTSPVPGSDGPELNSGRSSSERWLDVYTCCGNSVLMVLRECCTPTTEASEWKEKENVAFATLSSSWTGMQGVDANGTPSASVHKLRDVNTCEAIVRLAIDYANIVLHREANERVFTFAFNKFFNVGKTEVKGRLGAVLERPREMNERLESSGHIVVVPLVELPPMPLAVDSRHDSNPRSGMISVALCALCTVMSTFCVIEAFEDSNKVLGYIAIAAFPCCVFFLALGYYYSHEAARRHALLQRCHHMLHNVLTWSLLRFPPTQRRQSIHIELEGADNTRSPPRTNDTLSISQCAFSRGKPPQQPLDLGLAGSGSMLNRVGTNPLLEVTGIMGAEDTDDIRVHIDPLGTFLLPIIGLDPIVLDGRHIHTHLGLLGVEVAVRPPPKEVTVGCLPMLERRNGNGSSATQDEMFGFTYLEEERLPICLWNHGMVSSTGGFTAETTMGMPLSSIVADESSLEKVVAAIHKIRSIVEAELEQPLPMNPVVLRIIHKDRGVCRMQATVAPVIRSVPRRQVIDGKTIEDEHDVLVGALICCTSMDAKSPESNIGFRNAYLAQIVEHFHPNPDEAPPLSSATRTPENQPAFPVDPDARERRDKLNEHTMILALRGLAIAESFDETRWEPIYSSAIPQLVQRSFRSLGVQCVVDEVFPEMIECDVHGVTQVLQVLFHEMGKAAGVEKAVMKVLTPSDNSVMMVFHIGGLNLLHVEEAMAVKNVRHSPLLSSLKKVSGFVKFCCWQPHIPSPDTKDEKSAPTGREDSIQLMVPFREHTGVMSSWTRNADATVTCRMSMRGTSSPKQMASPRHTPTPSAACDPSMTVMVCERNEVERHRLCRSLWESSNAVCTPEGGDFGASGIGILRSGARHIDAVIITRDKLVDDELISLQHYATEFCDVVFVFVYPQPKKSRGAGYFAASVAENIIGAVAGSHQDSSSGSHKDEAGVVGSQGNSPGGWGNGGGPSPTNLYFRPKSISGFYISELISFTHDAVRAKRDEIQKKKEMERVLKEHRSSPWVRGKLLGKGTFGDVYEAELTLTGGKAAVKCIRLQGFGAEKMETIKNEISIQCNISHPNIVQYFYSEKGEDENEINVFMELCKGGSLAQYISRRPGAPSLSHEEVSAVAQQVVSALAYLHSKEIAHRDIKPANILINDGKAKLADFGTAAFVVKEKLTEAAGTLQYMAPEVFEGKPYGLPCDIWSVGCVVMELLHAAPSHESTCFGYFTGCESDEEMWGQINTANLRSEAIGFIKVCLHRNPQERASAEQLLIHPFLFEVRKSIGLARKESTSTSFVRHGALSICSEERESGSASDVHADRDVVTASIPEAEFLIEGVPVAKVEETPQELDFAQSNNVWRPSVPQLGSRRLSFVGPAMASPTAKQKRRHGGQGNRTMSTSTMRRHSGQDQSHPTEDDMVVSEAARSQTSLPPVAEEALPVFEAQ